MTRYKLACFDLDGTLVDDTIFIWQTLHDYFGTDKAAREEASRNFHTGVISYQDWVDHDVALLKAKGATRERMVAAIGELRLMSGARETVMALQQAGLRLAVISGSLSLVLEVLFPDHPFDDVLINRFEFDHDGTLLRGIGTKYDIQEKATGLKTIAEREGFSLAQCVFIGDNVNDVEVARIAGLSIAFNWKSDDLAEVSRVVLPRENKDLRAVLPYILEEC